MDKAIRLDLENNNMLWMDAVWSDVEAQIAYPPIVGVTTEQVWSNKWDTLHGGQEMGCQLIFDVKMDFTWQACFVAGGHMTAKRQAPSLTQV